MPKKPVIFVSHATPNRDFANRLSEDLRNAGATVWISTDSIAPGEDFVSAINNALVRATHMVVVMTPDALASTWVKDEINVAVALQKQGKVTLIVLDVEPSDYEGELPLLMTNQKVSFQQGYKPGLKQLRKALGLKKKLAKQSSTGSRTTVRSPETGLDWLSSSPTYQIPTSSTDAVDDVPFYQRGAWWVALVLLPSIILALGVGVYFLFWWIADVTSIVALSWNGMAPIMIAAAVWSISYVIAAAMISIDDDEWWLVIFGPLLLPYSSIFDALDFGEFLRGLFTAYPVSLALHWAAAILVGWTASTFLGIAYSTTTFVTFALLTLIFVVIYLVSIADETL